MWKQQWRIMQIVRDRVRNCNTRSELLKPSPRLDVYLFMKKKKKKLHFLIKEKRDVDNGL